MGPLVVGCQTSADNGSASAVTIVGQGDATPTSVTETFLAAPFHLQTLRKATAPAATIAGAQVIVPQGADAEVEVTVPIGENDPVPPVVTTPGAVPTTVQMLFEWSRAIPKRVVSPYDGPDTEDVLAHEPEALPPAQALSSRSQPVGDNPNAQIRSWINAPGSPNGRKYYVVGRTDDLWQGEMLDGNNSHNNGLADPRAQAAKDTLIAAGVV